jgi:hypothetical protein
MEVEFLDVISCGTHVHCYLNRYYVARLTDHGDSWDIEICNRPCGSAPTRAEAEEVVRMWADAIAVELQHPYHLLRRDENGVLGISPFIGKLNQTST